LFANNSLGFDYSQDFVEQSKLNYQRYQNVKGHEEGNNIEFFQGDARTIKFDSKVLMFLFNPFGRDTLERFIDNNLASFKKQKSIMVYANDHELDLFKQKKYYGVEIIRKDNNLSVLFF
jgi:hypothetical protein